MSTVREVLSVKGHQVHAIPESSSVLEAVTKMHGLKIGCLVVLGENVAPSGMITERDVLRSISTGANDLSNVSVSELMTRSVIVCSLDDAIDKVRSIMKNRYVRQLPVVDDEGKVIGIVSLGDVSAHQIAEETTEIKHLHDYIHGYVR